jgi:hypothetical protein
MDILKVVDTCVIRRLGWRNMAIEEIQYNPGKRELPKAVAEFLEEADRRIDVLFETERNKRMPKYIPGDATMLYHALAWIAEEDMPLGRVYCEWGSGFGIGACLAAMLGYEAFGIEIEPYLVDVSQTLAADCNISVEILEGSYIPDGFESYGGVGGEGLVLPEQFMDGGGEGALAPCYDGMPYATDEIDVFFVYPWPGEQEFMQELFDALAAEGAILLAYYGDGEMCVYRKVE